jgi:hypothetical protein
MRFRTDDYKTDEPLHPLGVAQRRNAEAQRAAAMPAPTATPPATPPAAAPAAVPEEVRNDAPDGRLRRAKARCHAAARAQYRGDGTPAGRRPESGALVSAGARWGRPPRGSLARLPEPYRLHVVDGNSSHRGQLARCSRVGTERKVFTTKPQRDR